MNEAVLMWIIGGLATFFIGFVAYQMKTTADNERDNDAAHRVIMERLVRLETILALIGDKAAAILHSPHTPELDALLEKYLSRTYELSNAQWARLIQMCDDIENSKEQPKEARALAAIVSAVAQHKLNFPPKKPTKHE